MCSAKGSGQGNQAWDGVDKGGGSALVEERREEGKGVAGVQILEWLMDGRRGWAQYVPI